MAEARYLEVNKEEKTETVSGGQGLSSANVGTEAKVVEKANEDTSQNVRGESSSGEIQVETKVLGEQKKFAGQYLGNQKQVQGFERSKGDKGIVNTITVEETKHLIKITEEKLLKYINDALEAVRKGQYVKVNTETYPTLESFLASTGEQGTVYLYPLDDENHYDQYIWEDGTWVGLGTTELDLSDYMTLNTVQTATQKKIFSASLGAPTMTKAAYDELVADDEIDEDIFYFIREE